MLEMSISSVDSAPLHVKPEVDLNLAAEAGRILYVLDQVISRAKIVGLLKQFASNDGDLLKDILDSNLHFAFLQLCDKYGFGHVRRSFSSSNSITSQNSSKIEKADAMSYESNKTIEGSESVISGSTVSITAKSPIKRKLRNDSALTEVIYLMEENPEIRKLAKGMENELSPQMKAFIHSLTEFKKRMQARLTENAAQYKTREKYMRETFAKNELAKKEIESLEEELLITKTDANVCLIGRHILIRRHENKIGKIQKNSREIIEKKVNESEKAMVSSWKSSAAKQEALKRDLLQTSEFILAMAITFTENGEMLKTLKLQLTNCVSDGNVVIFFRKYANLLKEHLAAEKVMRAKRAKVENQVLGWIQKFDQDIGEKQAEEEEIQGLLDQETAELNEIQSKIDEQEEEYDELMQEKAQYEEEMLERRLFQFVVNRSARRIQRTYRLYKARKLAKKLAKKGKKGKKK